MNKLLIFPLFQTLADGLKTGETEWMEPLESTSAVNLTKAYLEGDFGRQGNEKHILEATEALMLILLFFPFLSELQNLAKTIQVQTAKTAEV